MPPKGLSPKPQFAPQQFLSQNDEQTADEEKDYVAALPANPPKAQVPPQFTEEVDQSEMKPSELIKKSHAINDDFMANIQAKLNMLGSDDM